MSLRLCARCPKPLRPDEERFCALCAALKAWAERSWRDA